jgi:hypothetical protein
MAEHQLEQRVQQKNILKAASTSPISTPFLTPEYPINQVLETVNTWLRNNRFEVSLNNQLSIVDSGTNQNLVIQSVATHLDNRQLALVTPGNKLLELSQEHNNQLLQLIRWELANYQYYCRLYYNTNQKFPGLVSSFQTNSSTILPPIRWFWRVIRWMQLSPVAGGINLFGESTLIRKHFSPLTLTVSPSNLPEYPSKHINSYWLKNLSNNTLFSAAITDNSQSHNRLSNSQLLNLSSINWEQIQKIIKAAIEYFWKQENQDNLEESDFGSGNNYKYFTALSDSNPVSLPAVDHAQVALYPTSYMLRQKREYLQKSSTSLTHLEPDSWQILILIQAAIDYFFSKRRSQSFAYSANSVSQSFNSPVFNVPVFASKPLSSSPEPDPWLSSEDIFPKSSASSNNNNSSQQSDPKKPQLPPTSSPIINPNSPPTIKLKQNHKIESTSDWVETKATPVGYIKHPLVRILEWLDQIILWLEEIILKIWLWLKNIGS